MLIQKRNQLPPQPGQVVIMKEKCLDKVKTTWHGNKHGYNYKYKRNKIENVSHWVVLRHFPGTDKLFYAIPIAHTAYPSNNSLYQLQTLLVGVSNKTQLLSSNSVTVFGTFNDFMKMKFGSNDTQIDRYRKYIKEWGKLNPEVDCYGWEL